MMLTVQPNAANGSLSEVATPEGMQHMENTIEFHMRAIMDAMYIDRKDPNAADTPKRFAKMLCREVCSGRFTKPPRLTVFPNTTRLDEVVVSGPITLRSLCSHHFCPIVGKAWVGYIPNKVVLGVSKFDRVVEWFAARPQIQEELTVQIADFLENRLSPRGLAVVVKAQHFCMTWRGAKAHPDSLMTTSVMRGAFREDASARAEFLRLADC